MKFPVNYKIMSKFFILMFVIVIIFSVYAIFAKSEVAKKNEETKTPSEKVWENFQSVAVCALDGFIPKDFDFCVISCDQMIKISLGDLYSGDITKEKELLSYRWNSPYGMKYQKKIFKGIELDFSDKETPEEMMVFIISLSDESWLTFRGAHVGMTKEEVLKLYGEPSSDNKNFLFYYNDDFDELEIHFYYDSDEIVQRIMICMGT